MRFRLDPTSPDGLTTQKVDTPVVVGSSTSSSSASTSFSNAPMMFPDPSNLGRAISTSTVNATATVLANIHKAPKNGQIAEIKFATATVTTGSTYDCRLETLTAGNPSGSLIAAGANGSVTIADSDDNVFKTVTIGTPPTVSAGDDFAIVLRHSSGSPNWQMPVNTPIISFSPPYRSNFNGTSWTQAGAPYVMLIKYSGDTDYTAIGVPPAVTQSATQFNSSSTPDERGNKFVMPFSCRANGAFSYFSTANGDTDFVLYDDSDNVLATASFEADNKVGAGPIQLFFNDVNYVELTEGRTYRLTNRPSSTTNLPYYSMNTVEIGGLGFSAGQILGTSRTNAGAWTDDATTVYSMGLMIMQA